MKTKHLRSLKNLNITLDKYYKEKENGYDNKPYFMMSQKGFIENLYDTSIEIAVHVLLSTFSVPSVEKKIKTDLLNLDMLVNKFNVVGTKPKRVKERINESLLSLEAKNIIKINRIIPDKVNTNGEYFTIEQNLVDEKFIKSKSDGFMYFQLVQDEILKMTMLAENDNQRFNLFATYAAIVSRMNNLDVDIAFESGGNNWKSLAVLVESLNFSSAKDIADRTKLSLNVSKTYVEKLVELKVIARVKVHKMIDKKYQWSYFYSKYSQKNALYRFVKTLLLHSHLPDNSEFDDYKDYSWLNIDDVWDPDVHGKGSNNVIQEETESIIEESQTEEIKDSTVLSFQPKQEEEVVKDTGEDGDNGWNDIIMGLN